MDKKKMIDIDSISNRGHVINRRNAGMEYSDFCGERPISDVYPVIDTDAARDNIENDLSAADLQDLQ